MCAQAAILRPCRLSACNQTVRRSSKYRTRRTAPRWHSERGIPMKRLEGKVALVTGGNSGIGLASASRLREEGARVAISGRNQKTLDEAVKQLGSDVLAVRADVSKPEDLDKLYVAVSKKFGKIDVLFANAGIYKFAPVEASTSDFYDELFDINAKGVYF